MENLVKPGDEFYLFDEEDIIEKDEFIEMKCINCGHEEEIPDFVYGEEAAFLREMGDPEPPCFECVKCHKETLYRKGIKIPSLK